MKPAELQYKIKSAMEDIERAMKIHCEQTNNWAHANPRLNYAWNTLNDILKDSINEFGEEVDV